MFVTVRLPALVEPRSNLVRAEWHKPFPVFDILGMAGEAGHCDQGFSHFKVIREERSNSLAKDLSKVVLVTVPHESNIARVLVDLPCSENMLRKFVAVHS